MYRYMIQITPTYNKNKRVQFKNNYFAKKRNKILTFSGMRES